MPIDFLSEIAWRGQLHQCTDLEGLRAHMAAGRRLAYVGFDPTADSLTIGNLVPITLLRRWQQAGHTPVVVMGGGTGLIGDPSGKSAERQLMTAEIVAGNVQSQRRIFEKLLDFSPGLPNRALIVNNLDWLGKLTYIEALRDIGKHFSVNMMIQKDSVRERLHARDQGISYTEFSYMILQSYDYLHLFREQGVTVQMGGSDQWGNIVGGADLIRRCSVSDAATQDSGPKDPGHSALAFGLTTPLITKADGGKFGKTESGAIWLTADRTSPYAYYQFWLNAADDDAGKFLRTFSTFDEPTILDLEAKQKADPGARPAQRALARDMTDTLHGPPAREQAESAAAALFSGDVAALPPDMLDEVFAAVPSTQHDKAALASGIPLADLLPQTSLATSKSQARQSLTEGSVAVNGKKAAADMKVTTADLLHGRVILLRRGKKNWHVTRWA